MGGGGGPTHHLRRVVCGVGVLLWVRTGGLPRYVEGEYEATVDCDAVVNVSTMHGGGGVKKLKKEERTTCRRRCYRFVSDLAVTEEEARELAAWVWARRKWDGSGFSRVELRPEEEFFPKAAIVGARRAVEARSGRVCWRAGNGRLIKVPSSEEAASSAAAKRRREFEAGEWSTTVFENHSPRTSLGGPTVVENHSPRTGLGGHPGFGWHRDGERDPKWRDTAIVYLTASGGETVFADAVDEFSRVTEGVAVVPKPGRVLGFSAGPENTHRAGPTDRGVRAIVQTQWGLCEKTMWLVVHPPKTAGRTARAALQNRFGRPARLDVCDGDWTRVHTLKTESTDTADALRKLDASCLDRHVRLFVLLRDPIQRLLSEYAFFHSNDNPCYSSSSSSTTTFASVSDFLRDLQPDPQLRFLLGSDYLSHDGSDNVRRALDLLTHRRALVSLFRPGRHVHDALRLLFDESSSEESSSSSFPPPLPSCPHLEASDLSEEDLRLARRATSGDQALYDALLRQGA